MIPLISRPIVPLAAFIALIFPLYSPAQKQFGVNMDWLPITGEERALKSPTVEKDAGVECLFWRVHVIDDFKGQDIERELYHYVRLKVFAESGKEKAGTIDIPFGEQVSILDISGRTVKADGSVVELKKDVVYERDVIRIGRIKRRVKSFAMPGVEPGAIVEYRWREVRHNPTLMYMRLQMQREFPVRKVTYLIKPLPSDYSAGYRMSLWPFNCKPTPARLDDNGFAVTSLENVPAFREEPMMPGEGNVRPWVLAYYHDDEKREPEKYWNTVGKRAYTNLRGALKANDELKAAAAKAVAGASGEQEKVLALIRYLRRNVRGFGDRRVSDAERAAIVRQIPKHGWRSAADVFKSGIATPSEMNTLFAAMASQVGLEARPALIADRNDVVFVPRMTDAYFLPNIDMAVKIGEQWRIYDVSSRLLPPDMLGWSEEGTNALLSDPKKPEFIVSSAAPPEASRSSRTAKFALLEDGTLEGDIEESYTGHRAAERRRELEDKEAARQTEDIKEEFARTFPQAEITGIRVEGADAFEVPVAVRYHVKIPGYAQRTGRRILFQPLFFQRGDAPMFEAGERRYDVFFPFSWQESDQVEIRMPAGFVLDNAQNPGALNLGKVGEYKLDLKISSDGYFRAERQLIFGREGLLLLPVSAYPMLKSAFDEIHRRDGVTIALKQAAR